MSLVLEFVISVIVDLFYFGGYGALGNLRQERRQRRELFQRDAALNR